MSIKDATVETAVILFGDRYMPPAAVAEQARELEASGVVDYLQICDQLVNFIPPALWIPENAPLARVVPDIDSCPDAFALSAYCSALAPNLGLVISTDSIRHAPAEMTQTMLTLSNITGGRTIFQIGGGEVKQAKPYGWKRAEGLKRMEDLFRVFHAFMDSPGPIDFEGNHVRMSRAYLGGAKQHRPMIWGLGGGPRLIDLATTYADGLSAAAPCVWATPEQAAKAIAEIKKTLAEKGRDPEDFKFGIFSPVLLHEDPETISRALDNPLVRWMAATYGRIDPADWANDGLESPVPEGWSYWLKMLPYDTSPGFLAEVLSKSTRSIAEHGLFYGSPAEVAAKLAAYIDAGISWILPVDYMPLMVEPDEVPKALGRSIEVCRLLKAHVGAGASLAGV
jgi:phthiodiolone/phenolphthiodiolone dimycocerosates ketoreductase